jgi:hypothetical protein
MLDPTSSDMDRLPKVLQKEIWEYVRGDQAYWKQQFSMLIPKLSKFKTLRISRKIDQMSIRLIENHLSGEIDVAVFAKDCMIGVLGYSVNGNRLQDVFETEVQKFYNKEEQQIMMLPEEDVEFWS